MKTNFGNSGIDIFRRIKNSGRSPRLSESRPPSIRRAIAKWRRKQKMQMLTLRRGVWLSFLDEIFQQPLFVAIVGELGGRNDVLRLYDPPTAPRRLARVR